MVLLVLILKPFQDFPNPQFSSNAGPDLPQQEYKLVDISQRNRYSKCSQAVQCLTVQCSLAVDPRLVGTRRLMMLIPTYLTTNLLEKYPQADHALFELLL